MYSHPFRVNSRKRQLERGEVDKMLKTILSRPPIQ